MNILSETWLPATSTFNYLMKDPLLDWLKEHYLTFSIANPKFKTQEKEKSPYDFTEYILKQGKIFERKVVKMLVRRFGQDRVVELNSESSPRNPEKAKQTLECMNKGIPIIYSGLVYNPANQTFGIPDLLVRSDWLNLLVTTKPLAKSEETKKASKLQGKWHYRVIDIKYKCLSLRADQKHLLNSSAFPAYKSQLCINNSALGFVQGYVPDEAYILGRRWEFTTKGQRYFGNSCFDRLGVIDYKTVDKDFVDLTTKALEWLREVKKDESRKWNILNYPLSRKELYPNMKNKFDNKWLQVKKQIAEETKELTSLWMVGVKNRNLALTNGVSKWTDKTLTSSVCGVNGEKTSGILREIIKVNQSKTAKIFPKFISNNIHNWKQKPRFEFFVDFETYDGVISTITNPLKANTGSMIFMIGVGYFDEEKKWISKTFISDKLTYEDELKICKEFVNFLQIFKNPRCIHWSFAEPSVWGSAVKRHPELKQFYPDWLDLLDVFREEPIVINGAFSFSLKDVARAMKKHKMIKVEYGGECTDGQSALVGAYHSHKVAIKQKISMKETEIMKEIVKYNKIDVLVMFEIITYLRENHLSRNLKRKRF